MRGLNTCDTAGILESSNYNAKEHVYKQPLARKYSCSLVINTETRLTPNLKYENKDMSAEIREGNQAEIKY